MKVIEINASTRKDGNTAQLLRVISDVLQSHGIETEQVQLSDAEEGFDALLQKMEQADGILLGSPFYIEDAATAMPGFLRHAAQTSAKKPLRHKVGAAVAAARRGEGARAIGEMTQFFLKNEMFVAGTTCWNIAADAQAGLQNAKNLAENMAFLLKKVNQ